MTLPTLWAFAAALVKRFLLPVLFLSLPFAAIWLNLDSMESSHIRSLRTESLNQLAQITNHFKRLAQPESKYRELARTLASGLRWQKPLTEIATLIASEPVTLYFFRENGKRLLIKGFNADLVSASERYLRLLERAGSETIELSVTDKSVAESFSGSFETVSWLARHPNQLLNFHDLGLKRLGGWFRFPLSNGMTVQALLWVDMRSVDIGQSATLAAQTMARIAPREFKFGFYHYESPQSSFFSGPQNRAGNLFSIIKKNRLQQSFAHGSALFSFTHAIPSVRLFACRRSPHSPPLYQSMRGLLISFYATGILLACFSTLSGWSPSFSIRTQLTVIFGVAGGLPLIILFLFSFSYRETRQSALLLGSQAQAERILEKIDRSFLPSYSPMISTYQALIKRMGTSTQEFQSILSTFAQSGQNTDFYYLYVVNPQGVILARQHSLAPAPFSTLRGKYEKTVSQICQQVLSIYNYDSSLAVEANLQQDSVLQKVLTKPSENLLKRRGSLQPINLAGEDATIFIDFILEPQGKALALLFAIHDTKSLEAKYLAELSGKTSRSTTTRILALPRSSNHGLPTFPENISVLHEETLNTLFDLVAQKDAPHHLTGRLRSQEVLLSGLPGKALRDFHLFLSTPLAPIQEKIQSITRSFLVFSGIAVLFVLLLALTLSQVILGPLGILSEGIRHLINMNLEEEVDLKTGDDLEEIAKGINAIIEDLKDMSVAKTVQEQLLPRAPLQVAGLICQGKIWSPSGITREIYDFIKLPDGRVALFFAGISEPGLRHSLLIAMAKMAIRLLAQRPEAGPGQVLTTLLQQFQGAFLKVSHKSFFLAFLHPENGQGRLCRFGPCCVSLLHKNNTHEFLFPSPLAIAPHAEPGKRGSEPAWIQDPEREFCLPEQSRLIVGSPEFARFLRTAFGVSGEAQWVALLQSTAIVPVRQTPDRLVLPLAPDGNECREDRTVLIAEFAKGGSNA